VITVLGLGMSMQSMRSGQTQVSQSDWSIELLPSTDGALALAGSEPESLRNNTCTQLSTLQKHELPA
jgi:hypothetical protein